MKFLVPVLLIALVVGAFVVLTRSNKGAKKRAAPRQRRARSRTSASTTMASPPGRSAAAPSTRPTATGGAGRVNWLVGTGGDMVGRRFHVGDRTVTIGRAPSNYIQTVDNEASRLHCQVKPEGAGIRVIDMSSSNGTMINSRPINDALMNEGDTLTIGAAEFVFRRVVDFESDDGLGRKNTSSDAVQATAGVQGLGAIVAETVEACDGDLEKAAQILGVDVEFIQTVTKSDGANL